MYAWASNKARRQVAALMTSPHTSHALVHVVCRKFGQAGAGAQALPLGRHLDEFRVRQGQVTPVGDGAAVGFELRWRLAVEDAGGPVLDLERRQQKHLQRVFCWQLCCKWGWGLCSKLSCQIAARFSSGYRCAFTHASQTRMCANHLFSCKNPGTLRPRGKYGSSESEGELSSIAHHIGVEVVAPGGLPAGTPGNQQVAVGLQHPHRLAEVRLKV